MTLLTKPPMRSGGIPIDPADAPAVRRYKAIKKRIRKGQSEAEAIASYDKQHTCSVCGDPCHYNATWCTVCGPSRRLDYKAAYRAAGRHLKFLTCTHPGCTTTFTSWPGRKFCAEHRRKPKPKKPKKPPKPRKPKKIKPPKLPRTWEEPRPEKPVDATPVIQRRVKVKFYPLERGRWAE